MAKSNSGNSTTAEMHGARAQRSRCGEAFRLTGRFARPSVLLLCVLVAGLTAACGGDKRPATVKVRGTVQWQGQPAAGAQVILHPVAATGAMEKIRPNGRTDSAGVYELSSFMPGDGCPAGEYRVTVVWPQTKPGSTREDAEEGPDRLKGKYADPETSGLTVTVRADQPELPPIVLR